MIFATNNEWSVPAGPRERRFCIIDVGEKHLQDRPYFKAVTSQMDICGLLGIANNSQTVRAHLDGDEVQFKVIYTGLPTSSCHPSGPSTNF
jgi:hypothetical protein